MHGATNVKFSKSFVVTPNRMNSVHNLNVTFRQVQIFTVRGCQSTYNFRGGRQTHFGCL